MGKPSKASKTYVEIPSAEKEYVNRAVIADELLEGHTEYRGGYVILLDGPDILTTRTLVSRGVPPCKLIIVERCEETYNGQIEYLRSINATDAIHIHGDINDVFDYLDGTAEVDALIFDGMTCWCESKLLEKFIKWPGNNKKLWYTIAVRNKAKRKSTMLTGQVKSCVTKASKRKLSLKVHHGYRRSGISTTMIVLYFTNWDKLPYYRHNTLKSHKLSNRKGSLLYETKVVGIKGYQFCEEWQRYAVTETDDGDCEV